MPDSPVIDAQVHAYESDRPERPWIGFLHGPEEATGDQMVAAMDEVGVDGALLVSPYSMYRYDASYALEVHAKHPTRFGLIKPFDPHAEDVVEQVVNWSRLDGTVGARIMLPDPFAVEADDPGLNRILAAGRQAQIPVNVLCWGNAPLLGGLAERNPDTQIVLDHLGLRQPFEPPPPEDPFGDLPKVLSLAAYENVAIKITGACTLSHEPYPYPDIWEPLQRIFDTFGIDRCLWGTDWTRAVNLLTYAEGVDAFRNSEVLSSSDRGALMGGNIARIYDWHPNLA
ncbi:MAG: amidohydrolase family protein [Gammaproteobacteria bacterium]|nr:amidohydrolase family protein [Gammaproteobacteria bacterium]